MSVVAVCAGKGSPGTTFVAVNLAAALAERRDVLLVDLDPSGGDVAAYLGLDPRRGLYPLLQMSSTAPEGQALLKEAEERAGFAAVCGFPDPCTEAVVWRLPDVLRAARSTGRAVVADLGRVGDRTPIVAVEADRVLLVVRPDLVSVAGAERALRLLGSREFPLKRIVAIVSGLERGHPGDLAEVAGALGVPVVGSVPLHRRAARGALLSQAPVAKGRVPQAFRRLAAALEEPEAAPVEAPAPVALEATS